MKKIIKLKYMDLDSKVINQEDGPFYDILKDNYEICFDDNPDYVIYGPFGDEHLKYHDAVKIFYTGECVSPDFNLCDYAIGFDYINFSDRYLRYPLWLKYGQKQNDRMMKKHIDVTEELLHRDFCSMVVSNDFADPMRDVIFDAVSSYKRVNSGGKYRNNINKPEGVECKFSFQSGHKFALALENCSYSGYTTEKLMEAFEAKTVPIYWGDPEVTKEFNSNSFINFHDFDSIEDFISKIKQIDNDDDEYLKMLREPALYQVDSNFEKRENELKEFLYNIFDQDKNNAFRRNLECWGKKYSVTSLQKKKVFDKYKKRREIIKKILRIHR